MCGPLIGPGHTGSRVLRRANHGVLLNRFYRLTCGRTGGLRNRPVRGRSSSCPTGGKRAVGATGAVWGRSAGQPGPVAGRGVVARSQGRMVWTGSGPRGVRASVVGGGRTSRQRQLAGPRADQSHRQGDGRGVRGDSRHKYKCFIQYSERFFEYLLACSARVSQSEDQNRPHPALASVHPMSTQVRGPDLGTPEGALRSDPQIATEPGASPTRVVNRPPSWRRRRLFVLVRRGRCRGFCELVARRRVRVLPATGTAGYWPACPVDVGHRVRGGSGASQPAGAGPCRPRRAGRAGPNPVSRPWWSRRPPRAGAGTETWRLVRVPDRRPPRASGGQPGVVRPGVAGP